jgi:outer membrane protein OmpA-like peptidoglycan-associated protein
MIGGGDAAAAQSNIDSAKAAIDSLCANAGFASTDECLAQYGMELPPVPGAPAQTPAAPESAAPADVGAKENAEQAGKPVVLDQAVEMVDPSIPPEEVAPLLDSAKDSVNLVDTGEPAQAPAAAETAPQEPAAPPPANDAAAQAKFAVAPAQIAPVAEEQGQRLQAAPAVETPPNVTIVNNNTTVVNNTTTNTTVNNTVTNNTGPTQVVDNSVNTQVILQVGNQVIVRNPQQDRDRFVQQDDSVYYEQLGRGRVRETVERRDGSKIVTVRNRNGDILQRSRITPDGREYVLAYFDESREDDLLQWRDPGQDLPPLRLTIPVREYVLDAENADEAQVDEFFRQPPVEQVQRLYSIDEVKRSARVRDSVRRLEVGGLTFDTGAATIGRDQVGSLSKVATAMQSALDRNPAETFLIEGHTDAVGSDLSNLRLSDLRAATVARILSDFYDIPPENLTTQGYGERYLKIKTDGDERQNRRVTVRRITPLVTPVASN